MSPAFSAGMESIGGLKLKRGMEYLKFVEVNNSNFAPLDKTYVLTYGKHTNQGKYHAHTNGKPSTLKPLPHH
jgi:hypothetical protein